MMIGFLLALCVTVQEPLVPEQPLQFSITHDGTIGNTLDGRVYVMLSKIKMPLISGPNWWNPEPFFAIDVRGWSAMDPLYITGEADAMVPLSKIEDGPWYATAIFRPNSERSQMTVPGGLHNEVISFNGNGRTAGTIDVTLSTKVPDRTWKKHKNLRLVEKQSPMLSEFHGKDIDHGACIIVPDGYDPNREEPYPVLYWISGYGSDHYGGRYMKMLFTASDYDDQICRVVLNAQAHSGHHVFADSDNNGPRMTALMEEFIPYLEQKYNLGGSGDTRFLAGHSSGGRAALWLQIKHPDFFNGTWSLAPESLDFRYFQTADLYAEDANVFVDSEGQERPIGRMGSEPVLWMRGFTAMDDVIKDGGKISSFEWVFSPKGEDGKPKHMFNRETGEVYPEVIEHWKQYDIRKYIEANWEELAPKLSGKINIIAGGLDTFYLEQPVISMKKFFETEECDSMIRIMENGNHGVMMRTEVIREIDDYCANKLNLINVQNKLSKPKNE